MNARPAGFVLVGVVIMVLALTILGLSLFSLSTYEAQFMQQSLDRQQALQSAIGGLDRARYALIAKNELPKVKAGLPLENVFYTRAMQFNGTVMDSTGIVNWSGSDVHIESAATVHGVTRWAEGWYVPHQSVSFYSRLMTLASVTASVQVLAAPLFPLMAASDSVWLAAGINFLQPVPLPIQPHVLLNQPVPVPNVSAFIAAHAGWPEPQIQSGDYIFNAPQGGPPTYFYMDRGHPNGFSYWDLVDTPTGGHTIKVNGRAILCVPHGIRFEGHVDIVSNGDPNACLVIVGQNGFDGVSDYGAVWFWSGVTSTIPTIFVSDGWVKIEGAGQSGSITNLQHLSVFANQVLLKGPSGGGQFALTYGNPTVMQAQIDFLFSFGALPNSASPSSSQLTLEPGTWRVTQ